MKKNNDNHCQYLLGNGGGYYKCKLTGKNCPYQYWCTRIRQFDFTGNKEKCKDFVKKEK